MTRGIIARAWLRYRLRLLERVRDSASWHRRQGRGKGAAGALRAKQAGAGG
jgi:hypothetical protein